MSARETIFGRRRAGMLAHVTSLPGSAAHGRLDEEAYRFIDFLACSGFTVWQTLPVGPVNATGSPYQSASVFAGNGALLPAGAARQSEQDYEYFLLAQAYWLEDYALYCALQTEQGGAPWYRWPVLLRDRDAESLEAARTRLGMRMEAVRREQHAFYSAWKRLKAYSHAAGVYLFGDVPMFAAHDSADVWAHREFFCVDHEGRMTEVAGAPPDAFTPEGQDWGCPQYRWDSLAQDGFRWWIERFRVQASLFDILRVDHFRGFEASWHVPTSLSAAGGRWEPVPGDALFSAIQEALGPLVLVAEDLGHITPAVQALRARLGLPGMHVLQFAFDGASDNPHLPHNHVANGVVYTGTHDNDTTLGWWQGLGEDVRSRVQAYFDYPDESMPWPLVHAALASVCSLAVLPLQDCLGLDGTARMNTPGKVEGNWRWRCPVGALNPALQERFLALAKLYGRDG